MKDIEEYEKEAQTDLTCPSYTTNVGTQYDISTYTIKIGIFRAKWAKYLYLEELEESKIQQELDCKYNERLHHYLYDSEIIYDKKDIPTIIKGDKSYNDINIKLKEQSAKIKFINEVLSALNSQSFYLNTALKHMLWKAGEIA